MTRRSLESCLALADGYDAKAADYRDLAVMAAARGLDAAAAVYGEFEGLALELAAEWRIAALASMPQYFSALISDASAP